MLDADTGLSSSSSNEDDKNSSHGLIGPFNDQPSGCDSDNPCAYIHVDNSKYHRSKFGDNDCSKHETSDATEEDNDVGEWIKPVTRTNEDKSAADQEPASQSPASEQKFEAEIPVPVNAPTQSLYLADLRLCGKAGTLTPRRITCTMHCTRCRFSFNWSFNFPGHSSNGMLNDAGLRSLPPHTVTCARCKQILEFVFHAQIAHTFENRLGALHLQGCVADDVPPKLSDLSLFCTECNQTIKINVSLIFTSYKLLLFGLHQAVNVVYMDNVHSFFE